MENTSEIILYQTEDGRTRIEVHLESESVWLTIDQMAELFQKSRSTINEHILNVFSEGELNSKDTMKKIGISDFLQKPTNFYNLDVIISVGYRVKSLRATCVGTLSRIFGGFAKMKAAVPELVVSGEMVA